ncbi:ABC transporter ATP-binding protein [Phyllobacterium endophyticum]|uniref:Spermidine/putrescine import ATP-binding protein PotA n=1 Tax=Phyllobacterium endophyticum TaxID=1149773 RepID=A0A2P7AST5_9HYPH|nr:ABC transporter ATP-binding protein [Phyllobacterium endophyticum]MBB3236737.1 spermidine/putrescine ABC transporter ATP-binding subunit [Phyllobacterium endophyticum]PSH57281.1 spermidine/putrescine ABC transporter ATP-binding protein [Phyllobacterium endophyticum]TYR39708.1 ABC transporter ATP-binding protein [Phyllobacterium endophyticum]
MAAIAPIIEIRNGTKMFGSFTALADINLSINQGEILTLLGPSGCGKTTLMRLIAGFENLTSGTIQIGGVDIANIPPERRPVNMVFQRYALFPHLDVFENVAFGLKVKGMPKEERTERVNRMLHIVQLESFANRYIDQLSGGQCQRVALARALVNGPKVLLLDEPLAALDLKIRQHMLAEMKRIHIETGATFVYVTHDQDEALILSDRVVLMEKGRVVQVDRPTEMYAKPKSLFAAKFLGETNIFETTITAVNGIGTTARTSSGIQFHSSETLTKKPSEKIAVSIRPESLTFQHKNPDAQSAECVVDDIVFMGSRSFYTVRLNDQSKVRVQVQRDGRLSVPSPGDKATIFWDASNVVMLPRD